MTLLILAFIIGIGLPTLLALVISWRETAVSKLPIVRHAPRKRQSATVLLYHTDDDATALSIRYLRRLRAADLTIIVVVPPDVPFNTATPPGIVVHRKLRPASPELTLASCYPLINPATPLGIITSGDIVTAPILHTALAILRRRKDISWLRYRREVPLHISFAGIMSWFRVALHQAHDSLRIGNAPVLESGTWLRQGALLRTTASGKGLYMPSLLMPSTAPARIVPLSASGIAESVLILATALPSYVAAAQLRTSLPLIAFWVISGWWLNVLISVTPGRPTAKIYPAACAPLGGILLPAWCIVLLGTTLQAGLRQRLAWARRQYAKHGIFFRLRHP